MDTKTKAAAKVAQVSIVRKQLSALVPHPRNPRKHPEPGSPAWESLKRSLEHDYFDPIVVNQRNGMLVSGHLRTKVLIEAGFTEADCVIVEYDEKTHIARMIAANRGAGSDDMETLTDLLEELDASKFDMDLTGFEGDSLEKTLSWRDQGEENDDADTSSEPKSKAKSQRHISIGRHRVPLTDEEFAMISAAYEAYEKRTGTRYGFIASLLTPAKKRKASGAQPI